MKIHISEQTRDAILATDNTFMIKDRGEISLKVSEIMTYIYINIYIYKYVYMYIYIYIQGVKYYSNIYHVEIYYKNQATK